MEPLNKGHVGTRSFVLYREISFIWRLKCTGIIGMWMSRFVLYREVSLIWSVLYWRFHSINLFWSIFSSLIFILEQGRYSGSKTSKSDNNTSNEQVFLFKLEIFFSFLYIITENIRSKKKNVSFC